MLKHFLLSKSKQDTSPRLHTRHALLTGSLILVSIFLICLAIFVLTLITSCLSKPIAAFDSVGGEYHLNSESHVLTNDQILVEQNHASFDNMLW